MDFPKELKRRPPEIILFADDSRESGVIRDAMKQRHMRFAEINPDSIRSPKPDYPCPTVFFRGEPYCGLREILKALNRNEFVHS